MFHILVVEDDRALRELFCTVLSKNGFVYHEARDGADAWDVLEKQYIDLVVTDIMMPNMNGFEFVKSLRQNGMNMPVLMITAKDTFEDMQSGFLAGTDDYMVKPFALDELLARLRALTRRSHTEPGQTSELLTFGDLTLDPNTREVQRDGEPISLTRTEFALLRTFMENPHKVLERNWLQGEVWGFDFPTTANSLEVYIGYLRRKTENGKPRLIHTVRGIGYILRDAQ